MRTLVLSFAAVVCLAMSARAQAPVDGSPQPTVSRDLLLNNVYVDMTPAQIGKLAIEQGWRLVSETPESMQFHTAGNGLNAVYTIFFDKEKVTRMVVSYIGQPEIDRMADRKLGIMRSELERNSDMVRAEGIRTVMSHATTDGRTMQVVWNQVCPMHVVVEINVTGTAMEVVPRLK